MNPNYCKSSDLEQKNCREDARLLNGHGNLSFQNCKACTDFVKNEVLPGGPAEGSGLKWYLVSQVFEA